MAAGKRGLARGGLDDLRHGIAAAAAFLLGFCQYRISVLFANQIVQVTSEAKASPTMTACTTMSALTNMFQGDRLRGSSAVSVAANAALEKVAAPAAPHQRITKSSTVRCMTTSRTDTVGIGYAAWAGAILSPSA